MSEDAPVITPSLTSSEIAQATFSLSNDIETISEDEIFRYDAELQRTILNQRPWRTDPHHFKKVRISAVALIKMVSSYRKIEATKIATDGDFSNSPPPLLFWSTTPLFRSICYYDRTPHSITYIANTCSIQFVLRSFEIKNGLGNSCSIWWSIRDYGSYAG